jgi:Rod binding domain-containing protein
MNPLDSAAANAQAAALSPSSYHDFSGLMGLKGRAREGGQGEAALRAAAQQFEAMFLQEMMRNMRDASFKSDLLESGAISTFEGMFDKEVSMQMAKKGGMGLADMMVAQMKKNLPADGAAASGGGAQPPSANDVLKGREAAGMPLMRKAEPHELNPVRQQPALPVPGPQAYPLSTGPAGMRLKNRSLSE